MISVVQLIGKGLTKLSFELLKGLGIGKVVHGTGVNFGHPTLEIGHPPPQNSPPSPLPPPQNTEPITPYPVPPYTKSIRPLEPLQDVKVIVIAMVPVRVNQRTVKNQERNRSLEVITIETMSRRKRYRKEN